MLIWLLVAALTAAFGVSVWLDPRTFRTGVFLFGAVGLAALALFADALMLVGRYNVDIAAWIVAAFLLLGLVALVVLGVLLVLAGLLVLRRARRTVANLLSLLLGLLILAYLGTGIAAVLAGAEVLVGVLALIALPAIYLGSGLVIFVGYSWLYRLVVARSRPAVDAIVVLGAGLRGRQVTPQLAKRLDRGHHLYLRSVATGRAPIIVVSGGQGPDEVIAESEAMRNYLLAQGVSPDVIVMEGRSRNTSENLQFSRAVLAEQRISGPVAVATSNYHAFRAAMLMRRWGVDGYAVGSRTPLLFWPNAVIREYLAILRDHLLLNLIAVGVLLVPLVLAMLRILNG